MNMMGLWPGCHGVIRKDERMGYGSEIMTRFWWGRVAAKKLSQCNADNGMEQQADLVGGKG